MRGAVVAALAVGFAGCADPGAEFQQLLSRSEPMTGQQLIVGPNYAMTFASRVLDPVLELPTSLTIGAGTEALREGTCPYESRAGIAVFPAITAVGGEPGMSHFRDVQSGPAVIQVAIDFDVPYTCSGSPQVLHGTTTYTFMPYRITRRDEVTPSSQPLTGPGAGCGCSSGSSFYFTSFWRFATDGFIDHEGVPLSTGNMRPPRACAPIGDNLVAVNWLEAANARIPDGAPDAFVYDFVVGPDVPTAARSVTSEIAIGDGTGRDACIGAHDYLARAALIVDDQPVRMNDDGIFVDPNVHNRGSFDIKADFASVPPFAILLDIGPSRHARVSRKQGAYWIQKAPDGPNTYLFYFSDSLGMNDSITIEPY